MQEIIPGLVEDLDKTGAKKVLGEDWEGIKPMLLSGPTLNKTVSVEKLLAARAACLATPEGIDGAPFLVLAKYLVDAMVTQLNFAFWAHRKEGEEPSPPPELELLKENGIICKLQYMGESYAAEGNALFPAYEAYPGTYWGQYAFINKMESGFSEDSYNQLPSKVITEGEDFLRKHPDSQFLTRALFLVGKAHESIYSNGLSHGTSDEGEKHRLAAIKYFADVLARPDGKAYEEHLKYILPRLRTKGSAYCAFFINCNPC